MDIMPEESSSNRMKFHEKNATMRSMGPSRRAPLIAVAVQAKDAKAMWSFLEPLVLNAPMNVSALAVLCLLDAMIPNLPVQPHHRHTPLVLTKLPRHMKKRSFMFHPVATKQLLQESQNQLTAVHEYCVKHQESSVQFDILLLPYSQTKISYTFAGYLIAWEHRILRAQSMNGYISTLGGGFFLCHHFQTAIRLAQEQQRLAILSQRPDVYWTGWIHQAYSHIYAGHFRTAITILRTVHNANRHHPTLGAMCQSARLQCKRMKRAALASTPSKTMDDWMRIRVVRDQSKEDDLRKSLTGG